MYLPKPPILGSLTPVTRLLFSILLVISCFAITFFIGMLLAGPIFGVNAINIMSLLGDYNNPKAVMVLQYLQVLQSFGLFIFPALLAGFFFERSATRYLLLNKGSRWQIYLVTLVLMFVALPFINEMVSLNEMMKLPGYLKGMEDWMKSAEAEATRLTETFMKMPTPGAFLFNMVMIALLPAIGEELLFRGLLQRLLKDWLKNVHAAIFISAFFFSAMHMQFYGFIPRMMLGVLFGYLFYWSNSIWVPVFAHFINNGAVVIIAYLGQRGIVSGDYENFGSTDNLILILASMAMTGASLWLIYRLKTRNPAVSDFSDNPG